MNTASSPENPPHDGAGMGGSHILRVVLSREVWEDGGPGELAVESRALTGRW